MFLIVQQIISHYSISDVKSDFELLRLNSHTVLNNLRLLTIHRMVGHQKSVNHLYFHWKYRQSTDLYISFDLIFYRKFIMLGLDWARSNFFRDEYFS